MNFGFAPDGDDHVANLRLMLQRQANTTLIDQPAVSSVRQFIGHLDKTSTIAKPVDDLLIGAHANHEGQFLIPMWLTKRTVFLIKLYQLVNILAPNGKQ